MTWFLHTGMYKKGNNDIYAAMGNKWEQKCERIQKKTSVTQT